MRKTTWRKHHKWLGIILVFFMLMFCLSGIILNHRPAVSDVNVSRAWLPYWYHYEKWNGGLLRGTLSLRMGEDSVRRVLVYGTGGIWQTDSTAKTFNDFNDGLPEGADKRQIRAMVQTPRGDIYALCPFALYLYKDRQGWQEVPFLLDEDERLSDMVCKGDTLVVAGRSFLYLSVAPYTSFKQIQIKSPKDYRPEVSLFRTVWLLHSGELFGTIGKFVVDAIAAVLVLLCITGLFCWLFPKHIRRQKQRGATVKVSTRWMRLSFIWHDKIGRITIILTLFIVLTGWSLRPPLMIPLVLNKVPVLPGTVLDTRNAWHDKIRMIRYDEYNKDWLLSTSGGFYSLASFEAVPVKLEYTPPVSVMGLNVWQNDAHGRWLCGSFSGMFVWDRSDSVSTDYFTNEPAPRKAGSPFGKHTISGYSADLTDTDFAVEYYDGTDAISQPEALETLPMSLWNLALEIHSGRIYMGTAATYVFVFFAGMAFVWCLWSGWKIRKRKQ